MPHENKEQGAMSESKDAPAGESKDVEVKPEDDQVATSGDANGE